MSEPLWRPSEARIENANITKLIRLINQKNNLSMQSYADLHEYSVTQPQAFWSEIWDFSNVIGEKGDQVLIDADKMPGAKWFPQASLNYAENLLRLRNNDAAIIFRGEDKVKLNYSWNALYETVSRCAQALRAAGVSKGDRVAAYMPNMPQTIIFMLAASSIGAVWSSCSPDFGVQGVVDRFGQIEPKILLAVDGYFYNGKRFSTHDKLAEIVKRLPSLEKTVVASYIDDATTMEIEGTVCWDDFIEPFTAIEIEFERLPFDHPLFIMFSSGTTGAPKCIVHSAGGTLLQHLKEHQLQTDLKPGERLFYFTTCGWMMWNWLVTGLASEATLLLFDGSPFYPSGEALFEFAQAQQMSVFGTSAKYIDALIKHKIEPGKNYNLDSLKALLSTGSPLSPQGFRYVYEKIKADICLSSISGGTDIISCFALGAPTLPVYQGELQCIGLGMNVKVLDDEGKECPRGEKGELSCVSPFPSMPIGFWNDEAGQKYHDAYFAKIENVWCHGDYVEMTQRGGMIIYGRSDAVLNPGGVRIGTAEIYRQVEKLDEIIESIVIGQRWNNDVRVVLFVKLREGVELTDELKVKIRSTIKQNTTPRHVPGKILEVDDIPRTKSGKIVELAVRNVVHGEPVKNKEALANPEALEYFTNRTELA